MLEVYAEILVVSSFNQNWNTLRSLVKLANFKFRDHSAVSSCYRERHGKASGTFLQLLVVNMLEVGRLRY
jgi:hypothetical protein